jgi:hypothetical protein
VNAVALSVPVRIELGLDPQLLADPLGGIGEAGDNLCLTVPEDGDYALLSGERGRSGRKSCG